MKNKNYWEQFKAKQIKKRGSLKGWWDPWEDWVLEEPQDEEILDLKVNLPNGGVVTLRRLIEDEDWQL